MNQDFASTSSNCTPSVCAACKSTTEIRLHYGAFTCHGCKAFFRRSISEKKNYVCSKVNNCNTTNESRNCCRACRLQKCIDCGMKPILVREERGRLKEKQQLEMTVTSERDLPMTIISPQECQLTHFLCVLERKVEMLTDVDAFNEYSLSWRNDVSLALALQNPRLAIKRSPMNWSCERIIQSLDVYRQWHRNVAFFADWANSIPEYRRLPHADQVYLFKKNYMAFGWMTFCYKCYEENLEETGMPLGNGSYIPVNEQEVMMLKPVYSQAFVPVGQKLIKTVVRMMKKLEMTFEEHCIMKTLCLFMKDHEESSVASEVCESMSVRLLEALSNHVNNRFYYLTPSQRMLRIAELTLLIPALQCCGKLEAQLMKRLNPEDLVQLRGIPAEITCSIIDDDIEICEL